MIATPIEARICVIGAAACRGNRLAHVEAAQALVGVREAPHLVFLPAEHLDYLVAFDRLFDDVHELAHRALRLARHVPQPARKLPQHERDQRRSDERDQRELPIEIEEPGEQRHHRDGVLDHDRQHAGCSRSHARDVVRDPRQQRPRSMVVEELRRHAHQAGEHLAAQVEHDAVGNPGHRVGRDHAQDSAHEKDPDDRERKERRRQHGRN
jgi:hypothetical protein